MKLKKIALLAASSLTLALVVSCSGNNNSTTEKSSTDVATTTSTNVTSTTTDAQTDTTTTESYYPITIDTYDNTGAVVSQTYESAPEKIICNNVSSAKTLIDLGLEDKIIGMLNPDNEVTDSYKEKIDKITKLGDKKTVSKEVIVSYEPDIIVGRAQMFQSTLMGTVEELNEYDITVYTQSTSVKTAELSCLASDIRNLGKIFNIEEKAETLALSVEEKIESLGVFDGTYSNALVMCNFNGTTFGAYKSVLQEKMLNTIGYTNVATGTSGLTLENLVTMNPELIIYVTSDRNASVDETAVSTLINDDTVADVPAILNDKIITVGYDYFMEYGSNVLDTLINIKETLTCQK